MIVAAHSVYASVSLFQGAPISTNCRVRVHRDTLRLASASDLLYLGQQAKPQVTKYEWLSQNLPLISS
jgi:hypothetical protein